MKKENIQIGITGGLVVLLVVLLTRALSGKKEDRPGVAKNAGSPMKVLVAEQGKEESFYEKLLAETRDRGFGRDPFSKQPIVTSDSSQALHLSGILWDEANPTAVINDEIVAVGSEIEGRRVTEITKNRVILEDGAQYIELILK